MKQESHVSNFEERNQESDIYADVEATEGVSEQLLQSTKSTRIKAGPFKTRTDKLLLILICITVLLLTYSFHLSYRLKKSEDSVVQIEKKLEFMLGFLNDNILTQGEKLELLEEKVDELHQPAE